jgi:hypothetical protein
MDARGVGKFALIWAKGIFALIVVFGLLAVLAIVNPFWVGLVIDALILAAIVTGYFVDRRRRSRPAPPT